MEEDQAHELLLAEHRATEGQQPQHAHHTHSHDGAPNMRHTQAKAAGAPPSPGTSPLLVASVGIVVVVWVLVLVNVVGESLETEGARQSRISHVLLSDQQTQEVHVLGERIAEGERFLSHALNASLPALPVGLRARFQQRLQTLLDDARGWRVLDDSTKLSMMEAINNGLEEGRHLESEIQQLLQQSASSPANSPAHHARHFGWRQDHTTPAAQPAMRTHPPQSEGSARIAKFAPPAAVTAPSPSPAIARTIHVAWANRELSGLPPTVTAAVQSWRDMNPGWEVRVWDDCDVHDFVTAEFPKFAEQFSGLRDLEQADLFRYLVLLRHGGVYTDLGTRCLEPIDSWDPPHTARLLVGVGASPSSSFGQPPRAGAGASPQQVQFCKWTIAAAPSHPVLASVTHKILNRGRVGAADTTGPGVWTEAVAEYLDLFMLDPEDVAHGATVGDMRVFHRQAFASTQQQQQQQPGPGDDKGRPLVRHMEPWAHEHVRSRDCGRPATANARAVP